MVPVKQRLNAVDNRWGEQMYNERYRVSWEEILQVRTVSTRCDEMVKNLKCVKSCKFIIFY